MKSIVAGWVLVLLGWSVAGNASHEIPITAEQMDHLGITVAPVELTTSFATDQLPGRVVIPPRQERVVSTPAEGLVTGLQAGVGDEVKQGDLLAVIESPALIVLQREFLQANTEEKLAATDLNRDRQLFKEGIVAERRYLETRSKHERMAATLEERRQALRLAGMDAVAVETLERTRALSSELAVRAPISGVVLKGVAVVGQRVNGADPLYRLAQLEPLWLEIQVPLDRVTGVQPGAAVELPCPQSEASVQLIGRDVDPDSQTVLVRAEVRRAEDCLRPGQYVQVRLKMGSAQQLYRLPASAVVQTSELSVVFVQAPYGFAAMRVQIAGHDRGYVIVSGQLNAGESVAVSGLAAVKAAWLGLGGDAQ
jgi:cobalt-zinc-cadmium efflux system membrane fusion protein